MKIIGLSFPYRWRYDWKDYKRNPFKYTKYTIGNAFRNLRAIPSWIEDFIERGLKGYSKRDAWSLFTYIAMIIEGGLRELKENKHGYPCYCYLDDKIIAEYDCNCEEKWDEILEEMIEGFSRVDDDEFMLSSTGKQKFDHAMELFHEHFFGLWN